jgi:NADH:ubiquinone oxidoreductase subunit
MTIATKSTSSSPLSFIRRLSQIGTVIDTWLHGQRVGCDCFGNVYYRAKRTASGQRERRWVMYKNEPEASTVPPEWHGWLHHNQAKQIADNSPLRHAWQLAPEANQTGTAAAYFPAGHYAKGGERAVSRSDYEAWQPK